MSMGTVAVPLTRGKIALIDEADADEIGRHKWSAFNNGINRQWYAVRGEGANPYRSVRMHRQLLGFPAGPIDHVNGDGLDNRRCNLRACTITQNNANAIKRRRGGIATSRFKGVRWSTAGRYRAGGVWTARLHAHGVEHHLGCFASEVDAALEYDLAARAIFGRFARTNFYGE